MSQPDIAVVGMACVFPGARDLKEYWSNLVNGVDAVRDLPADEAWLPKVRGGSLPAGLSIDPQRLGVLPKAVPHRDPGQSLIQHLVDSALDDAQAGGDSPRRAMADLIVGQADDTVDAGCASSLIAVEHAVRRLREGQCQLAVAAGIFLNPTPRFAGSRTEGLLIGEGGGAVVLKRAEDAQADGDLVYAVIKGIGSSSAGWDVDVLAPSRPGQVRALQRAYADARVDPASIGYLELDGIGTRAGDAAEIQTIKDFYGVSPVPPTRRCMGSVQSMIGPTMTAAGMAALIKVCLALSNKVLPPTLHCSQPSEDLADAPFFINSVVRPWVHSPTDGPRCAAVNLFGFDGINVHAVLEEVDARESQAPRPLRQRPIRCAVQRASELVALSGPTVAWLTQSVDRLRCFLGSEPSECQLAEVAASAAREWVSDQPCQLSIVCSSLDELQETLQECALRLSSGAAKWNDLKHVYYNADCRRPSGKIALIFPGMGFPGLIGNYPDHLRELCLHYPEIRTEFDVFEARDRHPDDQVPTSSIFWPPESLPEDYRVKLKQRLAPPKSIGTQPTEQVSLRPDERYLAAMGVTLSNWVSWLLLKKFQIPVDMLAGQSQGEMAALCVSGVCGFRETAPGYWKALNIDWGASMGECMAFCWIAEQPLQEILNDYPESHIAIYFGPETHIIAGPVDQLTAIEATLRARQDFVKILPYPPIHTPRLSYLRKDLNEVLLSGSQLNKPLIPLYSSITTRPYPDDADGIRETMLSNLDRPLRLWETLHHMYADGARVFVQAGGGQIATNLETQLPRGAEFVACALDLDTVNPLTQLNHFCAGMIRAGVPLSLDALYEQRDLRRLDFDSPATTTASPGGEVPLQRDGAALASAGIPPLPGPSEQPGPAVVPADEADAGLGGMPLIGRMLQFEPEQMVLLERRLDLEQDLFLRDHLFVYGHDVKPVQECMPIVPMTFSMELMAEAAAVLSPGLGLIGFENVRAARWIGINENVDPVLQICAELQDVDDHGVRRISVTVQAEGRTAISATVLFADAYPADVPFDVIGSLGDPPWPVTAEQCYAERRMFHGPTLQTLSRLITCGNPGFSAELRVLPKNGLFASHKCPTLLTDPCLMDGIGQLVSLWLQLQNCYVLPTGIERIEIFAPMPAEGMSVPVRGEFTEIDFDLKRTRCNLELEDGSGALWMRITGWSDWIFKLSPAYAGWIRNPHACLVAQELLVPGAAADAVCCVMERHEIRLSELDRASRTALSREELNEMNSCGNRRQQYEFLLSRLAAKDAIRLWIARQTGCGELHPASIVIPGDWDGRGSVASVGAGPMPHLSLACTSAGSVAIASGADVGLQAEPRGIGIPESGDLFAGPAEFDLIDSLDRLDPAGLWKLRLWCAKQAAEKLWGAGLPGGPTAWEALDAEADGRLLVRRAHDGLIFQVTALLTQKLVFAYACGSSAARPASEDVIVSVV